MPIDPPNVDRPPRWAQDLVNAAMARNRKMGAADLYSHADLVAAWQECEGCCAVSGSPFSLQTVGDGQARRPFAPSLDRIDRHKPYRRSNVRLVVAIANFAMNAWGEGPLLQLASAVHQRQGDRPPPARPGPEDGDIDSVAPIDVELVETDIGTLSFPPRPDLYQPILDELRQYGERSSRQLEDTLATTFGITEQERKAMLGSIRYPAWRNHIAWALADLGKHKGGRGGSGQIERIRSEPAPEGGTMGIYRLACGSRVDPGGDAH
jgi:hypothetical protein